MSKKFYTFKPTYVVVAGDPNTNSNDMAKAIRDTFAAMRNKGRNPVLFGISGNTCSELAEAIAKEQNVPVRIGEAKELMRDLEARGLRKDHIQVILFQTPEYAASKECLSILYGCRRCNGTLRMWSTFHRVWLNCKWSADWVVEFNNRFIKTLGSYSMTNEQKSALFSERMTYLQKFPATKLYKAEARVYA